MGVRLMVLVRLAVPVMVQSFPGAQAPCIPVPANRRLPVRRPRWCAHEGLYQCRR